MVTVQRLQTVHGRVGSGVGETEAWADGWSPSAARLSDLLLVEPCWRQVARQVPLVVVSQDDPGPRRLSPRKTAR